MPQVGHAVCGRCGERQRSHVAIVIGAAFHCARRERVLLRDIRRFGTATIYSSVLRFGTVAR